MRRTVPCVTTPLRSCIRARAKLRCLWRKSSTGNRLPMLMKSVPTSFLKMRACALQSGQHWGPRRKRNLKHVSALDSHKRPFLRGHRENASRYIYSGRKSWWALSHTSAVDRALKNSLWDARGLESLAQRYWIHPKRKVAPESAQLELAWE